MANQLENSCLSSLYVLQGTAGGRLEQALAEGLPANGRRLKRKASGTAAAPSVAQSAAKKGKGISKGKGKSAACISDMPSMEQIAQEVAELHGQRG